MICRFEGRKPNIDQSAYISPEATIIGDVHIGKDVWIGPGAVLRGDYGAIRIGEGTSVQDNCICHAREGGECVVGNHVTVGHGAILHTCRIRDYAVIGMGAIISDYAVIGEWAIIGEGSVVVQRQEVPSGRIAVGIPARIVGNVTDEHKKEYLKYKAIYADLAGRYPEGLKSL